MNSRVLRYAPLPQALALAEDLLIRTAIRIELPPSLHELAVRRFEAVRTYIERDGSPLKDRVRIFYPQGSMAIRATIRSRKRSDGYDIDIVAELILDPRLTPAQILDLLFVAINGEPGSRYHGKVKRQSRCVTVEYDDDSRMHLDITPSLLIAHDDPRLSQIFHAKPEEPAHQHRRLIMNSHAFVEHVRAATPIDLEFRQRYAKEAKRYEERFLRIRADADVVPVPSHSTIEGGKSASIVALQLLKSNRNERYRSRKGVRMPPSVMLSRLVIDVARPGSSLLEALARSCQHIIDTLQAAEALGQCVDIRNPRCEHDRFTDRWPEDLRAQRIYIEDLLLLRQQLHVLTNGQLSLPEMRDLLAQMFGEGPAQSAIEDIAELHGLAIQRPAIAAPARISSIAAVPTSARISGGRAPSHSFYGTPWPGRPKR